MNGKKRSGRKPPDIVFTSTGKPPHDATARFIGGLLFDMVKKQGFPAAVINGHDGAPS